MEDLGRALAELSRVRSRNEPIVSVYLDVRWGDEQQRERVRLFVQDAIRRVLGHYAEGAPGRDALERTLGRVREWAAGFTSRANDAAQQGVALFACESIGLWRPLAFARPVENSFGTGYGPRLKQLVKLAAEAAPVLVVAPSREGADLALVRRGDVELEETIRRPLPRTDGGQLEPGAARLVGGEGPTSRYERSEKNERHDEDLVRRNRKAAAAELTAIHARSQGAAIVLVGADRTTAAFEKELPDRVAARVVARVPRPRARGKSDGIRKQAILAAAEHGREAARAEVGRRVDAVVGQALRGGIAVIGPEDVVLAVNEGRVHTLVIEQDFQRAGWRCDQCDALGANAEGAETCPFCGGDLKVVLDLGEALVARTLAVGGDVEVVPRDRRLHDYRGVGAFLRQTAPTGLRGASASWPAAPGATQP